MSVHLLKDARWIVQYANPEPPPRLKREYFGRGLEAEKLARDRNDSLGIRPVTPRTPDLDDKTFDMLADRYLEAKRGLIENSTYNQLHIRLDKIILPNIGHMDVRRLTHHRLDQYVNGRLTGARISGKERKPVKRTTVHCEVTYILAIMNWALGRKYIRNNPLIGYQKPTRDDVIIQPVTAEESRCILEKSPAHLIRALALSYYTGLRPGKKELLRLKWSDIDWDLRTILVQSARKGGLKSRTVPIHEEFLPIIKGWHKKDLAAHGRVDSYIITYRNNPISSIKKSFATAKKKAGITRKLPPYAFRHAFATNVLSAGGDLKSTSEILGHSRTDTTTRIYHHTNLTLHRKSINKLPPLKIPSGD